MIDELLDTLMLDQPVPREELVRELDELLRGAVDPEPILHSFQDKELLRIGVRDLLGKSPVRATTAALSDLAETILAAVARLHEADVTIVALGKLGGRELNYHSDLDLLVISDADGATERVQKLIRTLTQSGPLGRLYAVDLRLRPFGKSGRLVVPLAEFRRYFAQDAQLWERQSLGRARIIYGQSNAVHQAIHEAITAVPWQRENVAELRSMRERLQHAASASDLKRSPGGLVDVEFIVQLFQLKYGRIVPAILTPNVLDALAAIKSAKLLAPGEAAVLESRYTFLRAVETRLRIVSDRSLSEIPHAPEDREKLARRLGFETGERFQAEFQRLTADVRTLFDTILVRES
jgi:glutamate-ammonia-ligase adenylyltransferase